MPADRMGYEEAKTRLLGLASQKCLTSELVPLREVVGRVLAEKAISPLDLPRWDNSAMDGVAVLAPLEEEVVELAFSVCAGEMPPALGRKLACRIATGAPLPQGANAVVPVENCSFNGKRVRLLSAPRPGDFVRKQGSDIRRGELVVDRGVRLAAAHVLALAAGGIGSVCCYRKPKAWVLSTGDEVVAAGQPLGPGQIPNATLPYLVALSERLGLETQAEQVKDDANELTRVLRQALEEGADLILTTGAVSKGAKDFIPLCVKELGGRLLFHGVQIRPGKPILAAELGGALFLGLPGNPISTVVGVRFFLEPYLRALQGQMAEPSAWRTLRGEVQKPLSLRCFFKAKVHGHDEVELLADQGSHQVGSLLAANAWAILPEGEVKTGDRVETVPLQGGEWDASFH